MLVYIWGGARGGANEHGFEPVLAENSLRSDESIQDIAWYDSQGLAFALTYKGEVKQWGGAAGLVPGRDHKHRCTEGPSILPSKSVAAIATGGKHHAAVTTCGGLYTWGDGSRVELGRDKDRRAVVDLPKLVDGLTEEIKQVGCGTEFSVAVSSGGTAYAWGSNRHNATGWGGFPPGNLASPARVRGDTWFNNSAVAQISAGATFVVAALTDGKVYSWGANT